MNDQRKYFSALEILSMQDKNTQQNPNRADERAHMFFCGMIYWRYNEQLEEIEFLTINYRERGIGPLQKKFPGGVSLSGETPIETIIRESKQEVGHKPARKALWLIHNHQIEDRVSGRINHIKCFFLSNVVGVTLKTKTGADQGEASPIEWTPASQLVRPEDQGGIYKTHRKAFSKSCDNIAQQDKRYAYALSGILAMIEMDE